MSPGEELGLVNAEVVIGTGRDSKTSLDQLWLTVRPADINETSREQEVQ